MPGNDEVNTAKKEGISAAEGVRSSARLRNKSGQIFKKPDFVYDDGLSLTSKLKKFESIDPKAKSASCSNLTQTTLFNNNTHNLKSNTNNKSGQQVKPVSTENLSVNAKSKDLKGISARWHNKQVKLRQQRLDFLLTGGDPDNSLQNNSLFRTETQSNLSLDNLDKSSKAGSIDQGSQSSVAESFVSTVEDLNTEVGTSSTSITETMAGTTTAAAVTTTANPPNIKNTKQTEIQTEVGGDDWRSFLLKIQADINNNTKHEVATLRTDFMQGIEELKVDQNNLKEQLRKSEEKWEKTDKDLKVVQNELKTCQIKLDTVIGVTVRKDLELRECKDEVESLRAHNSRDMLRIHGIRVQDKENLYETVKTFFQTKTKITKTISLIDAYRVGKGNYKTIVIQLQNFKDRWVIFNHAKNLKGIVNDENKPYLIKEHLSAKAFAMKKRTLQIKARNKKLSAAEKLVISVERSKLHVDGTEYQKLAAPTGREILQPTTEELTHQLQVTLKKGEPKYVENQCFVGFTACVKSIGDVKAGYVRTCTLSAGARHVICAFSLPGRAFHILRDSQDDSEHGLGAQLLNLLEFSNIENRAIYVARYYDGHHIGAKRYDAILDAARDVLLANSYNDILDKHQYPLSKDEMLEIRARTWSKTTSVEDTSADRRDKRDRNRKGNREYNPGNADWDARVTHEETDNQNLEGTNATTAESELSPEGS